MYSRTKHARACRRGFSLIEIMVVLIVIGLIASTVGYNMNQTKITAEIRATQIDAASIRTAAKMWRLNTSSACPTMTELRGSVLDEDQRTTDAWRHEFRVECEGQRVRVTSAGPDGELDTEDDVHPQENQ